MDFGLTIYKCIHEWNYLHYHNGCLKQCLICGRWEGQMKDGKWVEIEDGSDKW